MPTGAFNICCPRDAVSRHNGGTSGAPLIPLRVDSALRALSSLRGLRGAPEVPPLCRETQSLGQQMLNAPVGINGLKLIKAFTADCGNIVTLSEGWAHQASAHGEKSFPNLFKSKRNQILFTFSDSFGTKGTFVWVKIDRKIANTISSLYASIINIFPVTT